MTTKLTLSIDDRVIVSAKKYAKVKGTSLSGLVENYLKSITSTRYPASGISPRVQKLMGSIQLPKNFAYKTEIKIAMGKKYSK